MTVTSEIGAAADAILVQQAPDATFHQAVSGLLRQIALATPPTVIESQASPIVRLALDVARTYQTPSGIGVPLDETAVASRRAAVAVGVPGNGLAGTPTPGGAR